MQKPKTKHDKRPKISIVKSVATVVALLILSPIIFYVAMFIAGMVTNLVAPESPLLVFVFFIAQIFALYRLGMWFIKRRYQRSPQVQEQRRMADILSTEKMVHRLAEEEKAKQDNDTVPESKQSISSQSES